MACIMRSVDIPPACSTMRGAALYVTASTKCKRALNARQDEHVCKCSSRVRASDGEETPSGCVLSHSLTSWHCIAPLLLTDLFLLHVARQDRKSTRLNSS